MAHELFGAVWVPGLLHERPSSCGIERGEAAAERCASPGMGGCQVGGVYLVVTPKVTSLISV
ncbi:hypothetical protein C8E87_5198 [Paractinoplanes brasiliensis]|uniref:Uncharacterized protein n=1 Tax=Paractinoplanes brasiliensis TaxID=52695 RepID=A0A4R6K2R0_9ACTN|nr:hypothetical protein C8E87_5198 [Actinoplanes brasiliensis]